MIETKILAKAITTNGQSLLALSNNGPVLLTFLRHFGCVFCREALHDLSDRQEMLKQANVKLVLVHMSEEFIANEYFEKYGVPNVDHISDPTCELYAAFGLAKGGASQLMGLKSLIRGFEVVIKTKVKPALRFIGDGFQMPGIFILRGGHVVDRFIHLSAADRPDYDAMIIRANS